MAVNAVAASKTEAWYSPVARVTAFVLYLGFVGTVAAYHEPWADEAQAWLIARDAPYGLMFSELCHYEGTPLLWHVILSVPAKLGWPYGTLTLASVGFASLGIGWWLWKCPLPLFATLLLPFTFFLFFQYAVVARSYVLVPGLLFAAAAAYRVFPEKPWPLAIVLALLSQTCVHGGVIVSALAFVYGMQVIWRWSSFDSACRLRLVGAGVLVAVAIALCAWQSSPASDHTGLRHAALPLAARVRVGWLALNASLAPSIPVSLLVLGSSLVWFWKTGVLWEYLAALAGLLTIAIAVYFSPWHEGLLFLVWLFAMWRSFDESQRRPIVATGWLRLAGLSTQAALAIVIVVQGYWVISSATNDLLLDYSASSRIAALLRQEWQPGMRIKVDAYHSIGILPHFERNMFDNFDDRHGGSFWNWSQRQTPPLLLPGREPMIGLLGIKRAPLASLPWGDPEFRFQLAPQAEYFGFAPGELFWKDGAVELDAFAVFVSQLDSQPDVGTSSSEVIPADWWRQAVASYAPRFRARVQLAEAHFKYGMSIYDADPDLALAHLRIAAELRPQLAMAHGQIVVYAIDRDPPLALAHARALLRHGGGDESLHLIMSELLASRNHFPAAIEHCQAALKINPNSAAAREALRRYRP